MKPYISHTRFRISNTDAPLPDPIVPGWGRYKNFQPLAEGGTCIIQTCLDQNLGRVVAYKTLQPDLVDNPVLQSRFVREARITSQIQHPNTPPVYEIGRDNRRRPYFTMKRVEGRSLRHILDDMSAGDPRVIRGFPLFRQLEILTQVAMCAGYAHACGVVHRDLKPANVQVGSFGEVILLDWGLAKVMDDPDDLLDTHAEEVLKNPELTRHGSKLGTPFYMSPEQVRSAGDLDHRSDVFSLGIILYELLTLEHLFQGTTADQVRQEILEKDIPPPSRLDSPYRITPELDAICLKALARDPDERYPDLIKFINDLDGYRAGGSISVRHGGSWLQRQLRKWQYRFARRSVERDVPLLE